MQILKFLKSLKSKKIFEIQPTAFGLDISDLTIKMAKLKADKDEIKLASFGKAIIPPGLIEEGRIKKEKEVVKVIQQLFQKIQGEKLKTRYVIASLPEQESFIRVVQLPKMKQEDLSQAVRSDIETSIPLKIDDLYFDWQIIPSPEEKSEHFDVLISAIPKSIVESYITVIKEAGFKIEVLEIESFAVARSLVQNFFSENPVLLIDMGARRTSFIIFSGQTINFTSSLSIISGHLLTQIISDSLNIDQAEAERLKRDIGLDKTKRDGEIFQALEPILSTFQNQIEQYISFYTTHAHEHNLKYKEIQKIILAGGASNLIGLAEYLSSKLKISVELGNPWVNILQFPLKEVPQMSYGKSLEFTTALGLALRGLHFKK